MESEGLVTEDGGEGSRHPGGPVHSAVGLCGHIASSGGRSFFLYSSPSTAAHSSHTTRLLAISLALADSLLNHNSAAQNDINL